MLSDVVLGVTRGACGAWQPRGQRHFVLRTECTGRLRPQLAGIEQLQSSLDRAPQWLDRRVACISFNDGFFFRDWLRWEQNVRLSLSSVAHRQKILALYGTRGGVRTVTLSEYTNPRSNPTRASFFAVCAQVLHQECLHRRSRRFLSFLSQKFSRSLPESSRPARVERASRQRVPARRARIAHLCMCGCCS